MTQVLIVDDQEQNLYLLQVMLQAHGYEVRSAHNGIEALALARREAPDLIITDILMPGMDGFSLCRAWMADEQLRRVPLVFYTATYTDAQDEAFALSLGATRFILKPAEPDAFLAAVRQVLANHQNWLLVTPSESVPTEDYYSQYSQALIRKLEAKMTQIEETNRSLQRDIAERKRVEAALRESEARFRVIFERANDAIHVDSTDDRILEVNSRMCEMMGYSREELLAMRVADLQAPELRGTPGQVVRSELARYGNAAFEGLNLHRSGRRIPVELSVARIEGAHGDLFVTIVRDITERKQAEAERERLLAQVQAQAQQITQIMDSVPAGVMLLAGDGHVLLANPRGERALDTLAGAAVGERLTHLGGLPLAELFAAAVQNGALHEVRAGRRVFEAIAHPLTGVSADIDDAGRWVLVVADVTQAHDLRQQLQQQERLAAVGQLAAGIAHDFNNILAIIALHAPLVACVPYLGERERERLNIIGEQAGYGSRLIQQLLDFSRRTALERRPLDLAPLLKEHVKLLTRTLPETISVTLDCEPGEHVVLADPTRLQQVMMNLAVNARDAMSGGGHLRLMLMRQEGPPHPGLAAGPWIRLEVADDGMGIAADALPHIFEPFFSTKPRGQGTGLGLAQVHGIIKQHEGEIEVHSTVGQGATFVLYLPAVAEAASTPSPQHASSVPHTETARLILIVEDNPALLDAMSDIIEIMGYRVMGVSNGAEALDALAAHGDGVALVLSDMMMPVMNGEALVQAMRSRGLATPVVILSGYPLDGDIAKLKTMGVAGWLLKPPDVADLARLLAQALNRPL